ncbi:ATP-dependent metallopeptidase FtsH/Yme1/Tma family protein [Rhizobium sp. BK176]|uniref:ATP-dependent metallopeptidase FtsH/Yme1/Tma family protein n=1 Tax=Rhizobium sp. BK176 TaxID=2587071 RepID=UPI002166C5D3|nr:AAA family ATPase [Rhizobium sp. BK176]MCS4089886.1 cell division protease FtsH [Rhizobium sp. BK176]
MSIVRKIVEALRNTKPWKILAFACALSAVSVTAGSLSLTSILLAPGPEAVKSEPVKEPKTVDFTEFLKLLDANTFKKVEFSTTRLVAEDAKGDTFILNHDRRFSGETFPQQLARKGIQVTFPDLNTTTVGDYVLMAVQIGIQVLLLMVFVSIGAFMLMNARRFINPSWPAVAKNVGVRFSDVAGQEESKFELEEIRTFLRNPEAYEKSGAKAPRGVLLVGPPGTGKTLLAEALAGEAGVSYIYTTGSEFSNMFVGTGRDRVEKLFKKARKMAPCIIFIDEIDSLARARGASGSDVSREQDTTLNQLLTEMNGFGKRSGVIVVGATNRIDVLDPAILRPGRFDRHVYMGLPNLGDRRKILDVHIKGKQIAKDVDLDVVARGAPGFSGAEIENIVNEAAAFAARDGRVELTQSDFSEARDKVFMGAKRSTAILDDFEKKLTAYHEAGHAVVATLTKGTDPVHQATIIPRAQSLGHVMQLPEKEWKAIPMSRLLARLDVMVAGRMAEEKIFGASEITTGAASDIEEATKTATAMVTVYGMSERIGMRKVIQTERGFGEVAETEIDRLICEACDRARRLLDERGAALEAVAQALLDRETLTGPEIKVLVEA